MEIFVKILFIIYLIFKNLTLILDTNHYKYIKLIP